MSKPVVQSFQIKPSNSAIKGLSIIMKIQRLCTNFIVNFDYWKISTVDIDENNIDENNIDEKYR